MNLYPVVLRAVRAEALKAAALPTLRWTGVLTVLASALMLATLHSTLSGTTGGGPAQLDSGATASGPAIQAPAEYGFETVAWTWTSLVQLGFLAAGLLVSTAEHTSALGRTTLLVLPARGVVWTARLAVLAAIATTAAVLLVPTATATCPEVFTGESLQAAARTFVWLVAAALMAAGAGAALRQMLGAATALLLLVMVAPVAADLLGDAATWLPGVAARGWVRDGSWGEGVIVLAWTAGGLAAGAARLVRSDV